MQLYRVQGCVVACLDAVCVGIQGSQGPGVRFPSDTKVVYRRYASLFFVMGIGSSDNELVALEIIHRYVELLDKYFGNVCFFSPKQDVISLTRS